MNSNENSFNKLPDDVVLLIFRKLQDAKSLCISMSVCRSFHSIVPRVSQVFLPMSPTKATLGKETVTSEITFMNPVFRSLMKPFHGQFISQMINLKSSKNDSSYYQPNDVLKPFQEIRALHVRLPSHGNQKPSKTFLKWKADFGDQLRSCVILGAESWTENKENFHQQRVISDGEMKQRIIWTISCLIAASARHHLVRETVKNQKMIENAVVSDESDQGRLCMNKQQIEELKGSGGMCSGRFPAVRIKMWYSEKMEFPGCRKVMEGATLAVIWSAGSEEVEGWSAVDLVRAAFGGEGEEEEKVVGDLARKLLRAKECYVLEMNSFFN
ncbi:F-box protein At4g18380-like [Henckelia pumila]|uniref:F-box protein At4g18380-like n=1 Tax=Henckelia pumila TaxID=405737 RepID=UPI003C6E4BB2